jgi:hypothetical protein
MQTWSIGAILGIDITNFVIGEQTRPSIFRVSILVVPAIHGVAVGERLTSSLVSGPNNQLVLYINLIIMLRKEI